jgi:hypothetical protein
MADVSSPFIVGMAAISAAFAQKSSEGVRTSQARDLNARLEIEIGFRQGSFAFAKT